MRYDANVRIIFRNSKKTDVTADRTYETQWNRNQNEWENGWHSAGYAVIRERFFYLHGDMICEIDRHCVSDHLVSVVHIFV